MKEFTSVDINWDNSKDHIVTPPKCLAATIKNDGNSLVRINDSVLLQPGQNYQVPAIAGYYYSSKIPLKIVSTTGRYGADTIINVRYSVEI